LFLSALDSFEIARKLAPLDPIVVEEVAIGMLNQGQNQEASEMLTNANDRGVRSAQISYFLGLARQNQGSVQEAIQHYDTAIQLLPQDVQINQGRFNSGVIWYSLKEVDKSVAAFKAALEVDPTNAEGFSNLGGIQANAGAIDAAIHSLEKAVALGDKGAEQKLAQLRGHTRSQ
jgi:tetratricopeptide (TPR) repeat protein